MANILILNSSVHGASSVSNRLTRIFADQAREADPSAKIVVRDIGRDPIPHLMEETVAGIRAEPETEAEKRARALSDRLIAELAAADILVIGAPMYNFGMPSTLKTWFDHVLRARVTFRYSQAGPEGLMTGKKAIVVESRSGVYSEGPSAAMDFQEPHIRGLLGFMGITDVEFVRAEGLAFGEEAAGKAVKAATEALENLAERALPLAA